MKTVFIGRGGRIGLNRCGPSREGRLMGALFLILPLITAMAPQCGRESGPGLEAPGNHALPPEEIPMKVLRIQKHRITIQAPEPWQVSFRKNNPLLFAVAPGAGPMGPYINLVVEQTSQRMSPYDYLQANIISMKVSLDELEIKKGGVQLVAGRTAAWLHYTYMRGDEKIEALAYAWTGDYQAFVVTGVCPADEFDTYESVFRASGRSLRFY